MWPPYPLAYSFNIWYWNLKTVKAFGGLLIYTSHRLTGSQEEDWRKFESCLSFSMPHGQIFKKIYNVGGKNFEHKCYRKMLEVFFAWWYVEQSTWYLIWKLKRIALLLSEAGENVSKSQSFPSVFQRLLIFWKVWLSELHGMIWVSHHASSARTNGKRRGWAGSS